MESVTNPKKLRQMRMWVLVRVPEELNVRGDGVHDVRREFPGFGFNGRLIDTRMNASVVRLREVSNSPTRWWWWWVGHFLRFGIHSTFLTEHKLGIKQRRKFSRS